MMKRTLLLLVIGLALLQGVAAQSCGVADDSQLIYRISAPTNAHAEEWNAGGGYLTEICYNDPAIFNAIYPPAGGAEHNCNGSNPVLRFSASTNAHVQVHDFGVPYPILVCYGNLVCDLVGGGNPCAFMDPTAQCLGSVSDTSNAHISSGCATYPFRICCTSAALVPPEPFLLGLSVVPGTIRENDALNSADVTLTNLDSAAATFVDLVVTIIDSSGAPVRAPENRNNLVVAASATRAEDIAAWINSPTLAVGSYQITAQVRDSATNALLGTESAVLVVVDSRRIPVPELGAILLPLIGILVIVVLFLASEKERVAGLLGKRKKGKKTKAKKKPSRRKRKG